MPHPGYISVPPPISLEGGLGNDHAARLHFGLLCGQEAPVPLEGGQEGM